MSATPGLAGDQRFTLDLHDLAAVAGENSQPRCNDTQSGGENRIDLFLLVI